MSIEHKLKGKVAEVDSNTVIIEFGATQAEFNFTANGMMQRKLKLKEGDKVEIVVKKK